MAHIETSSRLESFEAVAGIALMFVCPILFFVGAWLVDRRVRRRGSAAQRWFSLAIFSAVVLAVFVALVHVPVFWQFSSDRSTLVSISYIVGLGWLATPLLAVPSIVIGVCGGVIFRVLASRRSAVTQ